MRVKLACGKTGAEITLPDHLDARVLEPRFAPSLADPTGAVRAALEKPTAGPSLAEVARLATAIVGNDSGLTHLAAAAIRGAGDDPIKVHVVYGSTDPDRTGPQGTQAHAAAPLPCWPCYRKRCAIASEAPCLEVPVAALLQTLVAP